MKGEKLRVETTPNLVKKEVKSARRFVGSVKDEKKNFYAETSQSRIGGLGERGGGWTPWVWGGEGAVSKQKRGRQTSDGAESGREKDNPKRGCRAQKVTMRQKNPKNRPGARDGKRTRKL